MHDKTIINRNFYMICFFISLDVGISPLALRLLLSINAVEECYPAELGMY